MNKNKKIVTIFFATIISVVCFVGAVANASEFTGSISSSSTSSGSQIGGTVGGVSGGSNGGGGGGSTYTGSVTGGNGGGSSVGGTVTTGGGGSGGNAIGGTVTTTGGGDNGNNTGTGGPIPENFIISPSNPNGSVLGASTADTQEPLAINSKFGAFEATNTDTVLPFTASFAETIGSFGMGFWLWILLLLLLLAITIYYIYERNKKSPNN